jgi:hypothetical protein
MRKLTLVVTAGLLITAASVAALAAAQPDRTSAQPALRLVDRTPFTVQGRHFRVLERVKVTLYKETAAVGARRVRASRAGVFTAALPEARIDRCDAIFVRAVGTGGSLAQLKLLPRPACKSD